MSVQGVGTGLGSLQPGQGSRFFLPGANEFASSLTVGQIIKGRVMRQYDGGRYQVSFDGQERVVDSAIPLKTGELIHGRVIGIGERVEVQRVHGGAGTGEERRVADQAAWTIASSGGQKLPDQVQALLDRFQVSLSAADQHSLMTAVRAAGDGQAVALAGAMLAKLGLSQAPELLAAVQASLRKARDGKASGAVAAANLDALMAATAGAGPAAAMTQLAGLVRQVLEDGLAGDPHRTTVDATGQRAGAAVEAGSDTPAQDGQADAGDGSRQLGLWLLNAQTDGAVAHRMGTIPLLVAGRLVEVEIALFEERPNRGTKSELQHRQLVFSLRSDTFGPMEIAARMAGDRVRLRVATEDETKTGMLAAHMQHLKDLLAEQGWVVDEIAYATQRPDGSSAGARAVIDHVISADSLNRVM